MSNTQVSLIITLLNEKESVLSLLESIKHQTFKPAEIIIVDGGSTDGTQKIIQEFSQKNLSLKINFISAPGNRSIGRNTAIKLAKFEFIAITDAGCTLESDWLAELIKCQAKTQSDVVSGYYRGLAKSSFQSALIPYVLVMPDKLPKSATEIFLPATRSMLISKQIWIKAGGFNEKLSDNEDFALAQKLVKIEAKISFTQTAIVNWQPPDNLAKAAKMFFRFARGDAQARILRPKVFLIFGRYFLGIIGLLLSAKTEFLWIYLSSALVIYFSWSIQKNFRYCQTSWLWLPLIQIAADISVMAGTLSGLERSF